MGNGFVTPMVKVLDVSSLQKKEILLHEDSRMPTSEVVAPSKKRTAIEKMYGDLLTDDVSRLLVIDNDKSKPSCLIIHRKGLEYRSKQEGELRLMTYDADTKEVYVDNHKVKDKGMSVVLKILKATLQLIESNKAQVLKEFVPR